MNWYRVPDNKWREADNGVSVWLPISKVWRFVDTDDFYFQEANFDWGWCGWTPCNVLYLTPTTNTVQILSEYGFDVPTTGIPSTRRNAGRPPGTSTTTEGISLFTQFLPALIVIGILLCYNYLYYRTYLSTPNTGSKFAPILNP